MEWHIVLVLPREFVSLGYGEAYCACIALRICGLGVWEGKLCLLYPADLLFWGIEWHIVLAMPRGFTIWGYGRAYCACYALRIYYLGVWEGVLCLLCPANLLFWGMERRIVLVLPRGFVSLGYGTAYCACYAPANL